MIHWSAVLALITIITIIVTLTWWQKDEHVDIDAVVLAVSMIAIICTIFFILGFYWKSW
jgi:hypothetical protein